ncbi:uncharacterized protein LOC123310279 [Coccinella septempunctata]|uniref:uncharacterized protein LOC123310279 n=1 Tax=Coccinella septempunctata TaxID=41139 RepID=UPI001D08BEA8|nr:uncharacterized protein LOC123310279 [Coccinella septempunctata]
MGKTVPKNEDSTDYISSCMENFNWSIFEKDFAEYHNAKERFYSQHYLNNMDLNEDDLYLDNLIVKLCDEEEIEIDNEASLLFRLLFRADFIQLSQKVRPNFYKRICTHFILTNKIEDILELVDDLDLISHVKSEIFMNLMKILNLKITIDKNCLTLNYIAKGSWYGLHNLSQIHQMIISPSAFKVVLEKFDLNFYHLNFILRLLQIKILTLSGCNLNWKEEGNILNGLNLRILNMSSCGTSVNKIVAENFENFRENLTDLNVSGCPLYNTTLELIAQLSLNELNIRGCIKKKGYFVENMWMEFADFNISEVCDVDINLLWAEVNLRNSLKKLDASLNHLDYADMEEILQLNLVELNVERTSEIWDGDCRNLWRNPLQNLKRLRIRDIEIDFSFLATLFELKLEVLEFTYDAVKNFNNFSVLLGAPMADSLRELTIDLQNHCQPFIHFLSHLKLRYFECKLGTWYYYNFDVFWNGKNRKYLKTLILNDGKISETDARGISALELETLSLFPFLFDSKEHILAILSSEVLRYSVVDLRMGGAYEVDSDHLNLLIKFNQLRRLSLKISGTNLTRAFATKIEHFKNLRELKLKVYIGLNMDEQAANALCNLPNGTDLTIVLVGLGKKWPLSFTEQASRVFNMKNFLYDSEIPVHLELSDCTLDYRCGRIFNKFNIESLILNSCVLENFLPSFLEEKIVYTLQYLIMKRVDIDNGQLMMLRNLCLNELSVLTSMDDFGYNKLPIILSDGAISKSLSVLRLGPYSCIPYIQYMLKSKMSVYELFPIYLL